MSHPPEHHHPHHPRRWRQFHNIPWRATLVGGTFFVLLCIQSFRFQNANGHNRGDALSFHPTVPTTSSFSLLMINENSTIANQVANIRHDGKRSLIQVELKSNSRCKNPVLRGRLSGPALVVLEWNTRRKAVNDTRTVVLNGHYSVPCSGRYFVEIIVLLCEELGHEQNFTNVCLQDPMWNRLTLEDATIEVVALTDVRHGATPFLTSHDHTGSGGYWTRRQDEQQNRPLYTRFQPQRCRFNDTAVNTSYCQDPMNVSRFANYEWTSNSPMLISKNNETKKDLKVVCLIGASHTAVLYRFMQNITSTPVFVETTHFPDENATIAVNNAVSKRNCTQLVIGMGQWSAGWPDKRPALFFEFERDMTVLLQWIRRTYPSLAVYVRSVHYNPIGDIIGSCPPHDWRSPPVIDGYNRVLQHVCRKLNVTFIDTNHIVGPMWDSAPDWCHFRNGAGEAEARYVAWFLAAS